MKSFMVKIYRASVGKAITYVVNKRDKMRGLDFAREVQTENGIMYGAPSTLRVRYIVNKYFKNHITDSDSIIDIGCGKGKMLTFFCKYPFKNISGLEYVKEMVDIAQNNLNVLKIGGGGKCYSR